MKKLLLILTLLSAPLCPAQDFNQSYELFDNEEEIDWNNDDSVNEFLQKLVNHYEKHQPKAILHQLNEEQYKYEQEYRNYLDITNICVLSALEKFALDYLKQNPEKLDQHINDLIKEFADIPNIEDILEFLSDRQKELQEHAHEIGLELGDFESKVLATLPILAAFSYEIEGTIVTNLFRNIVEYAVTQINK